MTTQPRRAPLAAVIMLATGLAVAPSKAPAAGADGAAAQAEPAEPSGPMSAVVGIEPDQLTCLVGGAAGGKLVAASDLAGRLRDGQSYRIFDLGGERGETIAIGAPRHEGGEGECVDLWRQELALDPRDKGSPRAALRLSDPGRTPLPDPLELMDKPLPEHVQLMGDFLSRRDIAAPEPQIVQAIRTDLDGDGTLDYILNLVRVGKEHAEVGDHSIVVVVRGEGAAQRTFIIQEETEVSGSDYPSTLWVNRIVAVLDVDGDGRAEIITVGGYLYGGGWEVIGWDGNGFEHMLFCGCDG
jgi:hypothetical protein